MQSSNQEAKSIFPEEIINKAAEIFFGDCYAPQYSEGPFSLSKETIDKINKTLKDKKEDIIKEIAEVFKIYAKQAQQGGEKSFGIISDYGISDSKLKDILLKYHLSVSTFYGLHVTPDKVMQLIGKYREPKERFTLSTSAPTANVTQAEAKGLIDLAKQGSSITAQVTKSGYDSDEDSAFDYVPQESEDGEYMPALVVPKAFGKR